MTFKGDVIGVETLSAVLGYLEETLDRYREKITGEQYDTALSVIQKFNSWQEGRVFSAEELYTLIICDDEEERIFDYAESGFIPGEEEIHIMWEMVLSVLMTVVRVAFEEEGLPYQQYLECIQIEQLNSFYGHILDGKMDTVQLYDYFCRQVCL